MANLKEKAEWPEGVYQLEPSDPVMGGENGIDNLQAKQLANRTLYLKAAIETEASTTTRGRVSLSSSTNSKSETEAATPLAVKTTYDLATGANNAANTALSIANTAKSDASTALNIANTAKSDANIAKNTANTANNRANTAYNTAINAFPKTGGIVSGLITSSQPKTYDIVASNSWIQAVSNTFPKAILAHEAGGGGFAIVTGADDARLGKTANLTFASWNGVGFAPMQTGDKEDKAINSTVVVNCRLGTVYALNGFYEQGKKLIKQDEYGVGHQNLSLTKISDNLNEQNASFFGSTYVNMPESIKPYISDGAGIVGIILPYRVTSEGWKFSSRIFSVVGDTPSKIFFQECHNGTWQKPVQLITNEIINNYQNGIGTGQTWQNVKKSRAIGVNYTNTTDKPILVNISLSPADGGFNRNLLYIDDIVVATSWQNSKNNNGGTLTAIVPVGSVYYLKSYLAIDTWTELR